MRRRPVAATIERMKVEELLRQLGGVATRRELLKRATRHDVDTAVRDGVIVKEAHGRYALPAANTARRAANRLTGVVSQRSAALLHGWEVKTVPEKPDVTVRRKRHLTPAQREEVTPHWADLTPDEIRQGVTTVERTLVDCMRSLPFDEALAIADSALRHRSISKHGLVELASGLRGRGAAQARRVAAEATHLAANPFESVARAIGLEVVGLDLKPQVVIRDRTGKGRADLVDRERRLVVECESHSWHSKRGALRRDCRRYTKLVLLGWRVLRFAWEDVMFHPDYVRECLETIVALIADEQENKASQGAAAA
jgi:very-short-patch-repair endonuclease